MVDRRKRLLIHQFVGFTEVGAALRVAKNDRTAQFMYHRGCNLTGKTRGLSGTIVHLPVTSNDGCASWHCHNSLSCKAATPGRTRPSRNSSEAPPPVET